MPALRLERRAARLGNHLVEPAVEPRQRIGDAVGSAGSCSRSRRVSAAAGVGVRDPFELARQIVETIVDRGEVVADRLLVVVIIAM